jgi:hypothetical protein
VELKAAAATESPEDVEKDDDTGGPEEASAAVGAAAGTRIHPGGEPRRKYRAGGGEANDEGSRGRGGDTGTVMEFGGRRLLLVDEVDDADDEE